jgi:hypothetical protein
MLRERMTIAVGVPNRPPEDLYEPHAREIARAVLPQPQPCCADQSAMPTPPVCAGGGCKSGCGAALARSPT